MSNRADNFSKKLTGYTIEEIRTRAYDTDVEVNWTLGAALAHWAEAIAETDGHMKWTVEIMQRALDNESVPGISSPGSEVLQSRLRDQMKALEHLLILAKHLLVLVPPVE